MSAKPITRWGLLWRSVTELDGETCHIVSENLLPALFFTRREAREFAKEKYGYINKRPDLRAEPHCWRVPQPIRVTISIGEPVSNIVAFLRTRDHVCADILADQIEAGKYKGAGSE